MSDYPEHDRLMEIHEESQIIGEFLDLGGYVLAEYRFVEGYRDKQLVPVFKPLNEILAGYFEIDLDKIESEKRQMLSRLRGDSNA